MVVTQGEQAVPLGHGEQTEAPALVMQREPTPHWEDELAVVVIGAVSVVVGGRWQVRLRVVELSGPQVRPEQQVPTRLAQSWFSSRHCMYWQ